MRGLLLAVLLSGCVGVSEAGDTCSDPKASSAYDEGFALQKEGRSWMARAAYERCLEAEPGCVACRWEIGWSHWTFGDFDAVSSAWAQVLAAQPDHADAKKWLPKAKAKQGLATSRPQAPVVVDGGDTLVRAGVLRFEDAPGPAGLPNCKASVAALSSKPSSPDKPKSKYRAPKADTSRMESIAYTGSTSGMPGANYKSLPLQELEAPAAVKKRIKEALSAGKAGKGLRISVFGASHTSADRFTGRLRRVLQSRWGDGGHGFILPAALYKWHGGRDVSLCRTDGWMPDWSTKANGHDDSLYGFAGMSVSSEDVNDFGWMETTSGKIGGAVDRFDIYSLGGPGQGTVRALVDESKRASIPGSSGKPELKRTRIQVTDGPHRLRLTPKGDGPVRLFGVSMEREGGVIVDALGIRGQEARSWLEWEPRMAAQGWKTLAPDIVVLAYGTNEAADQGYSMEQYEADLTAVLSNLRAALPPSEAACILAGPSDRGVDRDGGYAIWDRTVDVAEVQRRVATRFDCAFWDWQKAQGGPGSMVTWKHLDPPLAAKDLIHHTPKGYEVIADRFLAALDAL
jgi:lysophospholipase L1-like esterase